jgi:hypothetical protein
MAEYSPSAIDWFEISFSTSIFICSSTFPRLIKLRSLSRSAERGYGSVETFTSWSSTAKGFCISRAGDALIGTSIGTSMIFYTSLTGLGLTGSVWTPTSSHCERLNSIICLLITKIKMSDKSIPEPPKTEASEQKNSPRSIPQWSNIYRPSQSEPLD